MNCQSFNATVIGSDTTILNSTVEEITYFDTSRRSIAFLNSEFTSQVPITGNIITVVDSNIVANQGIRGNLYVRRSTVIAKGNEEGYDNIAISYEDIIIESGTVDVTGGMLGNVIIKGATVTATAGKYSAGIGGRVTLGV
ncbi:hypothetical protein SAMN05660297_03556 [Natronincola peptidivorans]|uniref:Uncharacterized protein n=1 Tax=Natronincola peptidivorans TaxID=426128 RepID=A0A1I0H8Z9_9FIRM|nr:hypothetical protein [Natronincola peptidivorans]SET80188.1 hypothetical protein SAMN05660297_03556 [Natronincola peptidivorans]